jgi:hypothetical protein
MFSKRTYVETAITIYEDQVRGWFFDHATNLERVTDHAGLVTLLIVLSYIEGHAIFYRGEDSKNNSKKFFRESFIAVFGLSDNAMRNDAVDELYRSNAVRVVSHWNDTGARANIQ